MANKDIVQGTVRFFIQIQYLNLQSVIIHVPYEISFLLIKCSCINAFQFKGDADSIDTLPQIHRRDLLGKQEKSLDKFTSL